jgi:glutamine synthetase type III
MKHSIEQLRAEITYVPEDGTFIRKSGKKSTGTINSNGYLNIRVLKSTYYAHRLGFLLHNGYVPKYIDHVNQDKADNRISNLREATASQNKANVKVRADSTTGLKGVKPYRDKFRATITEHGERHHLGTFNSAREAHCAYIGASIIMFGDFAFH